MDNECYVGFADEPQIRMKIIETMMGDGKTTNAHATNLVARLYKAGFRIVSRDIDAPDGTSDVINELGQIPHMTQRLR